MKRTIICFLVSSFVIIISTKTAVAQVADDFSPVSSNLPGSEYPKISKDLRVSVRLKAPLAAKVQVMGGDGLCPKPLDLTKDSLGNWNGIIPSAGPGFHYYWFLVDGVQVNDPGSDSYFGYGKPTSGIEIPSEDEDFYLIKNIPHGEIREHWYFSEITGKWRRAFVYTPPDYDKSPGKQYPILYLLHGMGENERGWSLQGHMSIIMDNLINEGKTTPMIVIMDNGTAVDKNAPVVKEKPSASRNFMEEIYKSTAILEHVYISEIIPEMESYYRVLAGSQNRAMAGLSMGGLQTMLIGLTNHEMFSYYGFFSAAIIGNVMSDPKTAFNGAFADAKSFNNKVKVMWFGNGAGESQFHTMVADTRKKLTELGINSTSYESAGTFHEWHTWRRCLKEFAPLLFK